MDYTIIDIKRQINSMIYLNIMSYSVLSGSGQCSLPDSVDEELLEEMLRPLPISQRPINIRFTDSLYKKCMPMYERELEDPYDFDSFRWSNKKIKPTVDLKVMASSIISCCSLIERLATYELQVENPRLIAFILYKTAYNQGKFIMKNLRVGNMFYNGEYTLEAPDESSQLQISPESPDRISQFAVLHALSALNQINSYNLFGYNAEDEDLWLSLRMLPGLIDNLLENLEMSSSRELAKIGLHLTEIYKNIHPFTDIVQKSLYKIGNVMCKRVFPGGCVARDNSSEENSSIATTANCLNLFSQLHYMFDFQACIEACREVYAQLNEKWDDQHGIFKLKDSNKQIINIKDTASIVAALFSYLRSVEDAHIKEHIQRQLKAFTEIVFIKSGIYNGQCIPLLQQNKMELHEALKYKKPWAPVFNKAFEYKLSKKKFYCEADVFRADYVLPACALMLSCINS